MGQAKKRHTALLLHELQESTAGRLFLSSIQTLPQKNDNQPFVRGRRNTWHREDIGNSQQHRHAPYQKDSQQYHQTAIPIGRESFELDELRTFVGCKKNETWVAYALCPETKEVVDFTVGKRSKKTLKHITRQPFAVGG